MDAIGFYSPWAVFWFACFMVAPLAHIYIGLMLLRDLCMYFPERVYQPLATYLPLVARLADRMKNASRSMDIWCVIEALFFVYCKLKMAYLQRIDPLEASLSAAPMLDPEDRKVLWDRIMECEQNDPVKFISGWFFDEPVESIFRYDVFDWMCWSMFDGRNQEHLTTEELHELELMISDLEYHISLQLYGRREEEDERLLNPSERSNVAATSQRSLSRRDEDDSSVAFSSTSSLSGLTGYRPRPKKGELLFDPSCS